MTRALTRTNDDAVEAEHWTLTTDEGRALLAEVEAVAEPRPADLARWRRLAAPDRVALAVRLVACRRRARPKFRLADAMWLDSIGLEQATAEAVARHKARRFAEAGLVVDLCSGIGGDAIALAGVARLVAAVDADPGMARRARWNATAHDVADRVAPVVARVETLAIPDHALHHIDPDRRASGKSRATSLRDYQPDWNFLAGCLKRPAGGAIKLGPASDFDEVLSPEIEVELIALGGECKEATAWSGTLASCRRRATVLPSGATWTDRDGPTGVRPTVISESPWVFDPSPALVRAGLLDGFAAAHGLSRLASGVDLLGGPDAVESPFLGAFEIQDQLPLDLKRLRRVVADRGLGPLDIRTRGLDLRPEVIRAQLRPTGTNPATLFLIGGRGQNRGRVYLARRVT